MRSNFPYLTNSSSTFLLIFNYPPSIIQSIFKKMLFENKKGCSPFHFTTKNALLLMVSIAICLQIVVAEAKQTQQEHDLSKVNDGSHIRAKRNWPFSSSQHNANIINSYYQTRPGDNWWTRNIQKPFARYVGRSFGDEFPLVRNSIIDYQNRGYNFYHAHMPWTGYASKNWKFNRHNGVAETMNPYSGRNYYPGAINDPLFSRNGNWVIRVGK